MADDAPKAPKPPDPPYDQALANAAAASEQCMKLGAVILRPKSAPTGFSVDG